MAGLPLKSGADFYNLEAARMRLHNLGADPTEVGAGLIYFNTSTGLNTSQKVRLYTGSAWKTIAFSEDFLALKDRVDLLSGDVDTDAIISNMKEVSAFLEGFAEDASLMDLLNGKLNTSGGIIAGNGADLLGINRKDGNPTIVFYHNGSTMGRIGFDTSGNPVAQIGGTYYNILTSAGGTIEGTTSIPLYIKSGHATEAAIGFSANNTKGYGYLIYKGGDVWNVTKEQWAAEYTLLHSGNVGEYALFEKTAKTLTASDTLDDDLIGLYGYKDANNPTNAFGQNAALLSFNGSKGATLFQLAFDGNGGNVGYRYKNYSGVWKGWKTIAFTDSNVASASKLQTARTIWGQSFDGTADVSGALYLGTGTIRSSKSGTDRVFIDFGGAGDPYIGYGTASAGIDSHLCGNNIYLHYGTSRTNGLILNSSGNVTIGASDLAGTDYKFYVNKGKSLFYAWNNTTMSLGTPPPNSLLVGLDVGLGMWYQSGVGSVLQSERFDGTATAYNLLLQPLGGNVLIGTTDDNGAKLNVGGRIEATGSITTKDRLEVYGSQPYIDFHYGNSTEDYTTRLIEQTKGTLKLVGDLHVTGNIIADGEVSVGGAAEEGGNAGGGGAEKVTATIEVGLKFKEISHTLGDNVIVQVYEWNANGQTWDMVLTDVETTTNLVTVRFGNETDVPHKVVII